MGQLHQSPSAGMGQTLLSQLHPTDRLEGSGVAECPVADQEHGLVQSLEFGH